MHAGVRDGPYFFMCMQIDLQLAYWDPHYSHTDGRIYVVPANATRAARFDPATNTWESFGDTFPETVFGVSDKWTAAAVCQSSKVY